MPKSTTFESTSTPGASFTLRTVGTGFRHRMDVDMADLRYKQQDLLDEYSSIITDADAFRKDQKASLQALSHEERSRLRRLDYDSDLVLRELQIQTAKRLLIDLHLPEELTAEGVNTFDDVLDYGPAPLSSEILAKAEEMYGLSRVDAANLERPSTSREQAEGEATSDTAAASASEANSTGNAIAAATSPTT